MFGIWRFSPPECLNAAIVAVLPVKLLQMQLAYATIRHSGVFLFSPFLLSLLMTVEVALVEFWPQQIFTPNWQDILAYTSLVPVTSLAFGDIFVVVGLVSYKAMGRLNLLKTETEPSRV
jgi:hypothetical protein